MISLKQILQEQADKTYEMSAELEAALLDAINQEEDPIALFLAGEYWNAFMASKTLKFTALAISAVVAAAFFRKPIGMLAKKLFKAGAAPINMIGKQLAVNAPWKSFLRLNSEGSEIWTRNAILKPLQTIKKNQPGTKLYQEADRLEGLIKNNTKPSDFLELAKSTRKMFASETYNALRKLRDSEGRTYISADLQPQFEKLFAELYQINKDLFNERYIRTTLTSLDIPLIQQENMLSRILPKYQSKIQKPMLNKTDLTTTQASSQTAAAGGKPKITFAQNSYMTSLPGSDRPIFLKIVDNLSTEIEKRVNYVDDLMQFDKFPEMQTWEKLNIPGIDNWGVADKTFNYNQDKLFYHANKLSGPTIK